MGAVAQLGERRVRNAKAGGSNPLGSTTLRFGIPAELRVAGHFFRHDMEYLLVYG